MREEHLKQFIQENREAFDSDLPPPMLLRKIQKQLQPEKPQLIKPIWRNWYYAAAASILIVIGAGIGWWVAPRFQPEPDPAMVEFLEAEQYYQQRIAQTTSQLDAYGALEEVAPDMEEIAGFIEELKAELDAVPEAYRPKVISSLIVNYQVKLELLDRVLHHLEEKKSKNHESL